MSVVIDDDAIKRLQDWVYYATMEAEARTCVLCGDLRTQSIGRCGLARLDMGERMRQLEIVQRCDPGYWGGWFWGGYYYNGFDGDGYRLVVRGIELRGAERAPWWMWACAGVRANVHGDFARAMFKVIQLRGSEGWVWLASRMAHRSVVQDETTGRRWTRKDVLQEALRGGVRDGVMRMLARGWTNGVMDDLGRRGVYRELMRTPVVTTPIVDVRWDRYGSRGYSGDWGPTRMSDVLRAREWLCVQSALDDVSWVHHGAGMWIHELCVGTGPGRQTYALFGALLLGLQRLEETGVVCASHGSMWEEMLGDWRWTDTLGLAA